jgi:hypothetical protein
VKYALAGMKSQLFVSKYQLALPHEKEMRAFIEARLDELPKDKTSEKKNPSKRKQKAKRV